MAQYMCLNCGYSGSELIYEFNDYSYCVASNEEDPEFIDDCPDWVKDKGFGEAEVGQPVGCPECRVWGVDKFQEVK
jgi:rubredoxin